MPGTATIPDADLTLRDENGMLQGLGLLLCALWLLSACASEENAGDPYDPAHDYFSFANTDQVVTEHLQLDLEVDFERRVFIGTATLGMRKRQADAPEIVLDTRDLNIDAIHFITGSSRRYTQRSSTTV